MSGWPVGASFVGLVCLLTAFTIILIVVTSYAQRSMAKCALATTVSKVPSKSRMRLFPMDRNRRGPITSAAIMSKGFVFGKITSRPLTMQLVIGSTCNSVPLVLRGNDVDIRNGIASRGLGKAIGCGFSRISIAKSPLASGCMGLLDAHSTLSSVCIAGGRGFGSVHITCNGTEITGSGVLVSSIITARTCGTSTITSDLFFTAMSTACCGLIVSGGRSC